MAWQELVNAHPEVKRHTAPGAGPREPVTCGCTGHLVSLECVPLVTPAGALGLHMVATVLLTASVLILTDQLVILV